MTDPFRLASQGIQRPGMPPGQPGLLGELQSEVPVEAAPLLVFVVRHIKAVVGVVLLFVAAIAGYGGWQWYETTTLRDAKMALGRIMLTQEGAARVTALEAFLPKAPKALRTGVLLTLAEAALAANEPAKAASTYRAIYQAEPTTALGYAAAINLADVLQRESKLPEALTLLEGLVASAPDTLRLMVREDLALAAESAGRTELALKMYEELAAAPADGRTPMERGFYQARVRELKARTAPKS